MSYLLSASYVPDTETPSQLEIMVYLIPTESMKVRYHHLSTLHGQESSSQYKLAKHVTIQKVQESEIKVIQIEK